MHLRTYMRGTTTMSQVRHKFKHNYVATYVTSLRTDFSNRSSSLCDSALFGGRRKCSLWSSPLSPMQNRGSNQLRGNGRKEVQMRVPPQYGNTGNTVRCTSSRPTHHQNSFDKKLALSTPFGMCSTSGSSSSSSFPSSCRSSSSTFSFSVTSASTCSGTSEKRSR